MDGHLNFFSTGLERQESATKFYRGPARSRVHVRPSGNGASVAPGVQAWIDQERERGLFEESTYDAFRERVERNREELTTLLHEVKADGKRIAGYGASARGNTLLNYFGIGTDLLDYIVDRNPLKHGLYSPGMHIPVLGVEQLVEDPPDYLLLIAWNFADEIIRQQEQYRSAGGRR